MKILQAYEMINDLYKDDLDDERADLISSMMETHTLKDEITDFFELRNAVETFPLTSFISVFERNKKHFDFGRYAKALTTLRLASNHL